MTQIKVLIVDDSPIALAILKRILSTSPDISVVGTAKNGQEGLAMVQTLQPDVICTDLHMPVMDGLEFTRQVMEHFPRPILVVSIAVQKEDQVTIFQLLEAGAIDVLPKPKGGDNESDLSAISAQLIQKIKILRGVVAFSKKIQNLSAAPKAVFSTEKNSIKIVGIGASTGGPPALQAILRSIPENFPVPIVCVQHISPGFIDGLVEWLGRNCKLKVKVMASGETPMPGIVYFPQENTHLEIGADGKLMASQKDSYHGHRPSVTISFNSLALQFGPKVLGVLLTGMGDDGAEGLLSVRKAGGMTIAQDEKSSTVFGMPKVAIELGAAQSVLPLNEIPASILKFF